AYREHRISTEVNGMLKQKHVSGGDRVKKGDVLFELDAERFELQVKEKTALLARAEAHLRFMRSETRRKAPLFKDKTLSQAGWDQAQFELAAALAERDQARITLDQSKRDLRLTTLLSPFDGVILETYHDTGEVLPAGSVLAHLADSSKITFDAGVSDMDLRDLSMGGRALATIDALRGQQFEGKITQISGNASPALGTFPVEITVENHDNKILPGMVGRLHLFGKTRDAQIIIPMMAVRQQLGETFVFVVQNKQAILKPVQLGRVLGDRVLVTQGVRAGDQLVVLSQGRLNDGTNIEVIR
ncbi:MAG: efflux RND transporter periplasmic adaptor subunit, partial [Nitrospiria bacterium]